MNETENSFGSKLRKILQTSRQKLRQHINEHIIQTMNKKRVTALATFTVMVMQMFSPYGVLLNTVNAAVNPDEDILTVVSVSPMEEANNGKKIFTVTYALTGDNLNLIDFNIHYDPSKIKPAYNDGSGDECTEEEINDYCCDFKTGRKAPSTLQLDKGTLNTSTNLIRVTASHNRGGIIDLTTESTTQVENEWGYSPYFPYFTLHFVVVDDSVSEISRDMLDFQRINLGMPTGYKYIYNNGDGNQTVIKTDVVSYKGFAEEQEELTGVEITGDPAKTAYNWGDTLKLDGLTITEKYASGDKNIELTDSKIKIEDITDSANPKAINMSPDKEEFKDGDTVEKTIRVTYTADATHSDTVTFPITIKNNKESIAMGTTPTKTEYNVKETTYDLTNEEGKNGKGDIIVTYQAGNTEVVALDETGVTLTDLSTLTGTVGDGKTVTVTYGKDKDGKDLTTSFPIDVVDKVTGVEITGDPAKTAYNWGDTLKLDGLTITEKYASGDKNIELTDPKVKIEDITDAANPKAVNMRPDKSEFESVDTVTKTIRVTYTADATHSDTITFPITIKNNKTKIEMGTTPTKTEYNVKETTYDLTNEEGKNGKGDIIVTYQAGNKKTVALDETGVTLTDLSTLTTVAGDGKTVTVTYGKDKDGTPLTTSFNIDVVDKVTGIEITGDPAKTAYNWGDTLKLDGLTITEKYASGDKNIELTDPKVTIEDVTDADNPKALNMSPDKEEFKDGDTVEKTIKVTYTADATHSATKTFPITIKNNKESIAMGTTPTKTEYNVKETTYNLANTEGKNGKGDIIVTYQAGNTEVVALDEEGVTLTDLSTLTTVAGDGKTVTVTYGKDKDGTPLTTSFNIDVVDKVTGIEITGNAINTAYNHGEPLDFTGIEIYAKHASDAEGSKGTKVSIENATITDITDGETGAPSATTSLPANVFASNKQVTRTIRVSYSKDEKEAHIDFPITVLNTLDHIEIATTPNQSYEKGDPIANAGGTIKIYRAADKNSSTEIIDITDDMITGLDTGAVGGFTATVTYKEEDIHGNKITKDDTYEYNVTETIQSITLNPGPDKTEYTYGEPIDLTGAYLDIVKVNGTTDRVAVTKNMISGFNSTPDAKDLPDTQVITVTYGKYADRTPATVTFEVTVKDKVTGIKLTPPEKTNYKYGEELNLDGGYVQKIMASEIETEKVLLTDESVKVTGFDPKKIGPQTVYVTYEGETKTFPVIVEENAISIKIIDYPKQNYEYGEKLDVTGGTIEVTRENGDKEIIPITESMVTGFDPNQTGSQTLTVTYGGQTDSYDIEVKDNITGIKITPPNKLVYNIGEKINLTGGKVSEITESGNTKTPVDMTLDMISGFDTSSEGAKTVIVTYKGKKATFSITVVDPLSDVQIITLPNKLTYKYGEKLDVTGGTIQITKLSGEKQTINMTPDMVTGYNPNKLGDQTLKVTYEGITKEFIVTVEDYITKLIVKAPAKTEYEYGEDLNLAGGKVSIIMASGAVEENVEMTASMVSGFNKTKEGTQTIKVEYKGLQGAFQVKVIDKIKGISIKTEPNKTDYKNGENLDLTGGTIKVVKSSGTETITITKDMVSGYNPKQPGKQVITINYGGFTTEFVVTVAKKVTPTRPVRPTKPSNNTPVIEQPIIENPIVEEPIIEKPITPIERPIIETPKVQEPIIEKPTEVLGVKDEQDNNSGKILAGCIAGIGALFLLILIVFRRNVEVYVFEDGEFVLGGKDKITKKNPRIDIDKFLDEETYPNQVKIRLNDSISEKLDGKEIEINHRGKTIKHTIKYNDEEYEIILK